MLDLIDFIHNILICTHNVLIAFIISIFIFIYYGSSDIRTSLIVIAFIVTLVPAHTFIGSYFLDRDFLYIISGASVEYPFWGIPLFYTILFYFVFSLIYSLIKKKS